MGQNGTEKTTALTHRQLPALSHMAASPTLSQAARSASACPELSLSKDGPRRPSTAGCKTRASARRLTASSPTPPTSPAPVLSLSKDLPTSLYR